tara:strand:+ start:432 stop:650 length:219 start_codon:yes stop_codon:yes gene_type:complete
MRLEECPRCSQFEENHVFKNCGFTVNKLMDMVVQEFECSRCEFKWIKKYESCSNNGSTFRREARQSELFESY